MNEWMGYAVLMVIIPVAVELGIVLIGSVFTDDRQFFGED